MIEKIKMIIEFAILPLNINWFRPLTIPKIKDWLPVISLTNIEATPP